MGGPIWTITPSSGRGQRRPSAGWLNRERIDKRLRRVYGEAAPDADGSNTERGWHSERRRVLRASVEFVGVLLWLRTDEPGHRDGRPVIVRARRSSGPAALYDHGRLSPRQPVAAVHSGHAVCAAARAKRAASFAARIRNHSWSTGATEQDCQRERDVILRRACQDAARR
jgi:hypothetical protein